MNLKSTIGEENEILKYNSSMVNDDQEIQDVYEAKRKMSELSLFNS